MIARAPKSPSRPRPSEDELVQLYWPDCRKILARALGKLPTFLDRAAIESAATLALWRAVQKLDRRRTPARQRAFVHAKIRWAIVDGLRSQSYCGRLALSRKRAYEAAARRIAQAQGRPPTEPEIFDALGWSPAARRRWYAELKRNNVSLESVVWDDGQKTFRLLGILREKKPNRQLRQWWRKRLVRFLGYRQGVMLAQYYFDGHTMREVGQLWGYSESRVSQIISQCLARLRETGREETLEAVRLVGGPSKAES
jgi:RNA polymerase sigma factor for flagellar operon FliA